MTVSGESQPEARNTKKPHGASILSPKHHTYVGFWNVRTMYVAGKTATIMSEMRKYELSILGLSEVSWTGFGELRTTSGETIIYSGPEEGHHRGVAIAMTKSARTSLM